MNKSVLLSLAILIVLFAQAAEANIIRPTVFTALIILISPPFILIPISLGLIFHRRFILIWNFAVMFIGGLLIVSLLPVPSIGYLISGLISAFAYASVYSIIAFLFSNIGKRFDKTRNLQEAFNRISNKLRVVLLSLTYFLFTLPILLVVDYIDKTYSEGMAILLGSTIMAIPIFIMFYFMYRKAKSLPKKKLVYEKSDYKHFWVIFLIFLVSIISSIVLGI